MMDPFEERYDDLGVIGVGSMGEVRRVRDRQLNRVLAMKIVRPEVASRAQILARFIEEAQATAQLEHPGIVPVHEMGQLADGRWFFTMKQVRGRTLTEVIQEVHRSGQDVRRLIEAFRRVCEAVAHAHARGVVHRDLKPDNIMVGDFGEVLVVDWGLAKIRGDSTDDDWDSVTTDRSSNDSMQTRVGTIAGTPMYMAPEQARGEIDRLDARTDVYALGAVLYEVLSGRTPYPPGTAQEVLSELRRGPPKKPPSAWRKVPEELEEMCRHAMAREQDDRYADAGVLAAEVVAWLEGARKRERALELVAEAEQALPQSRVLRERAGAYQQEAARLQEGIRRQDPIEKKKPVWELEDESRRLLSAAELEELRVTELLHGALTHAPDLPEAHALLAAVYRERHEQAEMQRDPPTAKRYELLLAKHDDGRHHAYRVGDGALTLVTDPPGAEVDVLRYVERERRLVPELWKTLGPTPIVEQALPMGSYLLLVRAPGRATVRYALHIERASHHDGVRPGDDAPFAISLPEEGQLGADDIYVPAGWFVAGGDPTLLGTLGTPRRRVWVDAFVIQRFAVTNARYLAFLDDLVRAGREEEALRFAPRERAAGDRLGDLVYGRRPDGTFFLQPDSDGDVWHEDWPVLLVDWASAVGFASWRSGQTGVPWRLPGELEWEKAARGVDGRFYPWGDFFDPTFACVRGSHSGRLMPVSVTDFDTDESPYGVRGMAGGIEDWCADAYLPEGPAVRDGVAVIQHASSRVQRVNRGGGWSTPESAARLVLRRPAEASWRSEALGFRLARLWRS